MHADSIALLPTPANDRDAQEAHEDVEYAPLAAGPDEADNDAKVGTDEQTMKPEERAGDTFAEAAAYVAISVIPVCTCVIVFTSNPTSLGWFFWHPILQSVSVALFAYGILTLQPTSRPTTKAAGLARHQIFMLALGFPAIFLGTLAIFINKNVHGQRHFTTWHGVSELCLIYPPHLIAVAAIFLTLALHSPTRTAIQLQSQHTSPSDGSQSQSQTQVPSTSPPPRRSSRSTSQNHKKQPQDIIGFMAGLNVSMPLVATIAQQIIALYTLWDRYKEDPSTDSARSAFSHAHASSSSSLAGATGGSGSGIGTKRPASTRRSGSVASGGTTSTGATPSGSSPMPSEQQLVVTPAFLTQLLLRMREARMVDLAHPATGRPVAVNKMLERTQAAG